MTRSRWAEENEEHEHFHALAVEDRNGEIAYFVCECGDRRYLKPAGVLLCSTCRERAAVPGSSNCLECAATFDTYGGLP